MYRENVGSNAVRSRLGARRLAFFVVAALFAIGLAPRDVPAATQESDPRVKAAVEVTKKAITACLMPDEGSGFEAYLETLHPDRKATDRALRDIRRYTWKRFRGDGSEGARQSCVEFIRDGDVNTLEMTRTQPETIEADAVSFKVFFNPISKPGRSAAPVIYRRDGERWLIDTNSL